MSLPNSVLPSTARLTIEILSPRLWQQWVITIIVGRHHISGDAREAGMLKGPHSTAEGVPGFDAWSRRRTKPCLLNLH